MDSLIPVSITIADRTYRIKVEPADEEAVRKTVKFINERLLEFKQQFAGKDMQDYVAMVLIWYATQKQGEMGREIEDQETSEGLEKLDMLLQKGLSNFNSIV